MGLWLRDTSAAPATMFTNDVYGEKDCMAQTSPVLACHEKWPWQEKDPLLHSNLRKEYPRQADRGLRQAELDLPDDDSLPVSTVDYICIASIFDHLYLNCITSSFIIKSLSIIFPRVFKWEINTNFLSFHHSNNLLELFTNINGLKNVSSSV